MFAEVADEMAEAKCEFIGSASITDNMPSTSVPAGLFSMLNEAANVRLRETLRDFGSGQGFRRDLFRRGAGQLSGPEHLALLDAITLVGLDKPIEDEISFGSTIGTITGKTEIYRPLIERLAHGPVTIGEIRAQPMFSALSSAEPINAVALLVSGGYALPVLPAGPAQAAAVAASRRLNDAIARTNARGGEIAQLVSPVLGSAVGTNLIESLVLGALSQAQADGKAAPDDAILVSHVRHLLASTGRNLRHDATTITDPAEIDRVFGQLVANARGRFAGILGRLGLVET